MLQLAFVKVIVLLLTASEAAGDPQTFCDAGVASLTCPEGQVISLERIQWRRPPKGDPTWGNCPKGREDCQCSMKDVKEEKLTVLQEKCNGKSSCQFKTNVKHLGENCGHRHKIAIIDWTCKSGLVRLDPPILDLNLTDVDPGLAKEGLVLVVGLPDQGALVGTQVSNSDTYKVLRVDSTGKTLATYELANNEAYGLVADDHSAYVIYFDSTVLKLSLDDLQLQKKYTLQGLLYPFGSFMKDGRYLSCVYAEGECSAWNFETNTKEVLITNVASPYRAIETVFDGVTRYIVISFEDGRFHVFDDQYQKLFTVDSHGSGHFTSLSAIQVLEKGEILVADFLDKQISEFSWSGEFTRQLLTSSDGLGNVTSMSYQKPHLWVFSLSDEQPTPNMARMHRYRLYQ